MPLDCVSGGFCTGLTTLDSWSACPSRAAESHLLHAWGGFCPVLLALKRALRFVAYTVEQRVLRRSTLPHPPRRYTREARLRTGRLGLSKSKERLDMPSALQERYSANCERFAALPTALLLDCMCVVSEAHPLEAEGDCFALRGVPWHLCPLFCARVPRGA
jgi:hypothetical protein